MKRQQQQQPSVVLALLLALLLCTVHQTAAAGSASSSSSSSTAELMRSTVETLLKHTNNSKSRSTPTPPKLEHVNGFSINTSTGNDITVTPARTLEEDASSSSSSSSRPPSSSSHCAYRVFEGGIGGQLCFRNTLLGYKCHKADCRAVASPGNLVANVLANGSVLLQWSHQAEAEAAMADHAVKMVDANATRRRETPGSNTVFSSPRRMRGGYELSCWWNGSFTQFECAGVHLGSGCRDFLLTELHENIPYRLCLRSLAPPADPARRDCVEFTLPLSGMQDIVIAMTTVGGAICVMLVIICLLVAYITENIMSPATQHSYSYRTHSCH